MLRSEGQIGRYEIRRRVATGGMGTLYLAHDPVLDRTVALKLFHGDLERPEARDKFVGEARAVAALNNPNIVTIYDYGEYAAQPFLVMEYIQGETLADLIRRQPVVPLVVTVRWMEDLCWAVAYAHERGIIHRDIKPANLMVDSYGRLKVLDFGIARMRGTLASQSTAVIGTPGYVAPEQIRGGTIDHRSDIFSIGVVCYELFSYTEAFGAESMHAVTHRTLNDDPAPLEQVRPSLDPEVCGIVARALQKDAALRYQSAEALREALAAVRRRLEAAEPETMVAMYVPPGASTQRDPATGPLTASSGAGGTPSPSDDDRPHRRTTREGLARQRQTQVLGWIDLAREHLAAGEPAEAREACTQALALDPEHPEALRFLASLNRMPDVTVASKSGGGGPDEVPMGDSGYTVLVPIDRRGTTGVVPEAGPSVSSAYPVGAAISVPAASAAAVSVAAGAARAGALAKPAAQPSASRPPVRARVSPTMAVAVCSAVTVLVAAGVWSFTRRVDPGPPLMVVIDAAPWATVASVEREGGAKEALPPAASTPLALSLEPGTYRVTLVGPPPASDRRELSVRVAPGEAARVVLERFTPMTVDEYFSAYQTQAAVISDAPPDTAAGGTP